MAILWSAGHETGDMSQWYADEGGGEFNSGMARSAASRDVAQSGMYAAELTIETPPQSGVRLFRWKESYAHPDGAYYSGWFYVPRVYRAVGGWWNIFQFKSKAGTSNDPFWSLHIDNRPSGEMYVYLNWWPSLWSLRHIEGPHAGEFGGKSYSHPTQDLPAAKWVHLEVFLRQSSAFDGQLTVWQDGFEMCDVREVRTKYPGGPGNDWSLNNYADGVDPTPTIIYVDDAVISTTRIGADPSPWAPAAPANVRTIE